MWQYFSYTSFLAPQLHIFGGMKYLIQSEISSQSHNIWMFFLYSCVINIHLIISGLVSYGQLCKKIIINRNILHILHRHCKAFNMSFFSGESWVLTILVLGSFQMLMVLKVHYVPDRFAAFIIHTVVLLDSLINFMWSIVPMLNHLDKLFLE